MVSILSCLRSYSFLLLPVSTIRCNLRVCSLWLTRVLQRLSSIITGIDALGRGQDLNNLAQALQLMQQFPEFLQALNVGNLATRIFAAAHIEATGLVKAPEELQAEQQAAMEQYAQQQGIDAGAQMAVNESTTAPE